MSNIQKTIDALKEAEKYLEIEVTDPRKFNNPMSQALEILSWDISNKISRLQEEFYWLGN